MAPGIVLLARRLILDWRLFVLDPAEASGDRTGPGSPVDGIIIFPLPHALVAGDLSPEGIESLDHLLRTLGRIGWVGIVSLVLGVVRELRHGPPPCIPEVLKSVQRPKGMLN